MLQDLIFKVEAIAFREALKGRYRIHDLMEGRTPPGEDVLNQARVLVTAGFVGASERDIEKMPNLSLICCIGTGYENVDLAGAEKRGILVTHGAGSNAVAVADHAVAMLLAIMRDLHRFDAVAKRGEWRGSLGPRPIPSGKRAGVVGLGGIGKKIAQRLAAFDMQVSYHTRTKRNDVEWRYCSTVMELADSVDCLILAAPGGARTYHMVDERILAALGPKGFLVNVSRGSLVDTEALVRALRSSSIAGAALDVFEEEPSIPAVLRELDNVILTPHVAAFAPEVHSIGTKLLADNIDGFLKDGSVVTPIPEMLHTKASVLS
jgi:lactate dehydrogenase-like 2-hydroxyacid dehydrogenase